MWCYLHLNLIECGVVGAYHVGSFLSVQIYYFLPSCAVRHKSDSTAAAGSLQTGSIRTRWVLDFLDMPEHESTSNTITERREPDPAGGARAQSLPKTRLQQDSRDFFFLCVVK